MQIDAGTQPMLKKSYIAAFLCGLATAASMHLAVIQSARPIVIDARAAAITVAAR